MGAEECFTTFEQSKPSIICSSSYRTSTDWNRSIRNSTWTEKFLLEAKMSPRVIQSISLMCWYQLLSTEFGFSLTSQRASAWQRKRCEQKPAHGPHGIERGPENTDPRVLSAWWQSKCQMNIHTGTVSVQSHRHKEKNKLQCTVQMHIHSDPASIKVPMVSYSYSFNWSNCRIMQ